MSLSNRFTALDDCPEPVVHVMSEGTHETGTSASDTESLECGPRIQRRRLSLVWNAESNQPGEVPEVSPVSRTQVDPPDSHDQRFARVRHTMQQERRLDVQQRQIRDTENFVNTVSRRVGITDDVDGIPRVLRRQQWSIFFVPLMWAAAEGTDSVVCWSG